MSDDNPKRRGPLVIIKYDCDGCSFFRTESYRVQGDSGFNAFCMHPQRNERDGVGHLVPKRIGDTTSATPDWCPYRSKQ